MLDYKNPIIQKNLFKGIFGLEKESLRLKESGRMSHEPAYYEGEHITRDFCENQTEINTAPFDSIEKAYDQLHELNTELQRALKEKGELLWPFSNPAYIANEEDIPIAFKHDNPEGYEYRQHLSTKYGSYLMTFCGIHYNFSFDQTLLEEQMKLDHEDDLAAFKERFYLQLAKQAALHGWVLTVLMAASPIIDSSFWQKGLATDTFFSGFATMRNSALGYWNPFVPIFDYSSLDAYARSIEKYIDQGLLKAARELYYPIRLKPKGKYTSENMRNGIDHIELRMIDLNPMEPDGLSLTDARFCHYFLIWLACQPDIEITPEMQIEAAENFKRASLFDLSLTFVLSPEERKVDLLSATKHVLNRMKAFFESLEESPERTEALKVIDFQFAKVNNQKDNRYANVVYDTYREDYLLKGLELAKFNQNQFLEE